MQVALVEMQRRVQSRVPLPWIQADREWLRGPAGRRPPARPLRRHPARLDRLPAHASARPPTSCTGSRRWSAADHQQIARARARRQRARAAASNVVRRHLGRRRRRSRDRAPEGAPPSLDQVLVLAMRPFLARCAEVADAAVRSGDWNHGHCPFCGWEPDFAVITPSADRRLICGRCVAQWAFGAAHLSVLLERRPRADHVVCDARRPVPRLRVRRLPAVSQGVRRAERVAAGDGVGGFDRDAAARRGRDAAGLHRLKKSSVLKSRGARKDRRETFLCVSCVLCGSSYRLLLGLRRNRLRGEQGGVPRSPS